MLLLLFNDPVVSDSLLYHGMLPSRPPCPSPSPGVCPSSCSLHCWCHAAISSSDTLFSFCTQSPSIRDFSNELSVCIRWPKYWSFRFSISPSSEYSGLISLKIDWFGLLAPWDSQELSPAPQSESINSWAFCLLYSPALTTLHGHWEDHSLDYTDFCQQSNVSTFQHTV